MDIPIRPLHPQLEDVLKETHGIMVYQEDVTKVCDGVGRSSRSKMRINYEKC